MYRRYYMYLKDRPAPVKVLVNMGDGEAAESPMRISGKSVILVSPVDKEVARFNWDEWQGAGWTSVEVKN